VDVIPKVSGLASVFRRLAQVAPRNSWVARRVGVLRHSLSGPLCAGVLISASLGCNGTKRQSDSDQRQAEQRSVAMGQEAANAYFTVRVLNTKVCTAGPRWPSPPGLKKISVELELQARSATEVPANPFYATLIDDKGRRFESTMAGCSPVLEGTTLSNGAIARGWVTFDVPESAIGQTVLYQPALVGIQPEQAELQLL